MYGAILGDIIGSHYETQSTKDYNFELFHSDSCFTDDTVLTASVCDAILYNSSISTAFNRKQRAIEYASRYRQYYHIYPNVGYGKMFTEWVLSNSFNKQNSYGNGAAMRVIPIGYAYKTIEDVMSQAKLSATYTHNNSEAIKGAQAVAATVFLARRKKDKRHIKDYLEATFKYELSTKFDRIKDTSSFDSRTNNSVPPAILCFLASTSYEDAIRKAISLGGDADTMACIAGGISEAYGDKIPAEMLKKGKSLLDSGIKKVIDNFNERYL